MDVIRNDVLKDDQCESGDVDISKYDKDTEFDVHLKVLKV